MAKKGNNNKNKVTRPGTGKFQELNSEDRVKYHDKYLDNTRRKMESVNMATRRGNELLDQEAKHVEKITKVRGEQLKQEKDLSQLFEDIYSRQQDQTKSIEQLYGIQNKLADQLQLSEGYALEIAASRRETRDMSLQDLNTNQRTVRELATLNRLKLDAVSHAQKLTLYNKENIPYYDKMNKIQAEIAVLTEQVGNNVDTEKAHRLAVLKTMHKEYETLGKLEQSNTRKEEIQKSINDLMTMQGTAAGQIFQTLKDLVTNPLLIFTGLLALGVSRFETMRGYGNQLAEEMDRVNKKLAGSGPYQQAIIKKARTIHSIFRAAGEGFAGSMESAVDAVQALQEQVGNIGLVSGDLVNLMSTIKLSINLSDDEVAKVINTYLMVGNHSEKAAENAANSLYSMSETVGLNPAETFREIANATGETLAHFRGGTHELNEAVITAKKMGLGLEDVAKISKGLLDFESSIEAEMEAQMLTGMNLNFNKARHFAMNKQGAKAAQEVLRQVGGLERFQDMNIFQQEAIARATGLSVDELLKTNLQRERENKLKREKQGIHDDTVKMLPLVTQVMGKIETGLGIIEKLANILGDIVLDVFGVSFKQAEELILRFVNSDTFQTGLKNILYFMKGVIEGIVDAISTVWDFIKKLPWIGDFLKNMGSMDMSGMFGGAQKVGKTVGKVLAYGYIAKKVLGLTPLTAMWVQSAGGALKGVAGIVAKGVKGLLGYGGQAMGTGLTGAASTAGYLAAGAFMAKGIYDVATLTGKNTRSEKAGAIGGAVGAIGGAKLGAAIGTAIAPGVGTAIGAALGAGVGYIGGGLVKHISWFQDGLDKSRIALANSENNLAIEANAQNNKLNMDIVKAQNAVRQDFINFGLSTDGATKNEIKDFADAMLEGGNITKLEHKTAIDGGMNAVELLERAAAGSAGKLTREQEARKAWVENQMNTDDLERSKRLNQNEVMYSVIDSLTDDMIEEQITREGLSERGKINYVLNPFRTQHDRDVLVREMYLLYKEVIPMEMIQKAVEDASTGIDMYVTKTDAVESGLEGLRDQLLQDVELLIADDQKLHNEKKLILMKKAENMVYDPITDGLVVTPKENPNEVMKRGGITRYDNGGVTDDPPVGHGVLLPGNTLPVETPEYKKHKKSGGTDAFWDFENNSVFQVDISQFDDYVMPSSTLGAGGEMDMHLYATTGGGTRGIQEQQQIEKLLANRAKLTKGIKGGEGAPMPGFTPQEIAQWIDWNESGTRKATAAEIAWHNQLISQPGMDWDDNPNNYRDKHWETRDAFAYGSALWTWLNQGFEWTRGGAYMEALFGYGTGGRKAAGSLQKKSDTSKYRKGLRLIHEGYTDRWDKKWAPGMSSWKTNQFVRQQDGRDSYGDRDELDANISQMSGVGRYDYHGNRKTNEEYKQNFQDKLRASGISTMQAVAGLVALGPAGIGKLWGSTAMGLKAVKAGFYTGPTMAGVLTAAEGYIAGETLIAIAKASKDIAEGKMGDEQILAFLKRLPPPAKWVGKSLAAYTKLPQDPLGAIMEFAGTGMSGNGIYAEKVAKALYKGYKRAKWAKDGYYQFIDAIWKDTGVYQGEPDYRGSKIEKEINKMKLAQVKKARGGITPNTTKVNDMILSADGQLIETHEDDNLIMKKGGITQKTGGGGSTDIQTINSLLKELIIVSNHTVVEVDGKVISENYQPA